MYELDPLDLFSLEKDAADKPDPKHEKKVRKKLDAGEQAQVGFSMATTGLMMAAPIVASLPLAWLGLRNTVPWLSPSIRGVKTLGSLKQPLETIVGAGVGAPITTNVFRSPDNQKFLGLFDIHLRPRLSPNGSPLLNESEMKTLIDIQPIVDSFLEKYELPQKGVTIDFRRSPLGRIRGAYYDPIKKRVTMPAVSKEVMLHELGHAADYTGKVGVVKNIAQNIVPGLLIDGLIPAAYFVGDEIKKAIPGTMDDKVVDFIQRHGPGLAMAALSAESLYPEAKASYLALKHIKEVEGLEAAKAAASKLGPMFGTYVLSTLPVIAGFALAKKYYYDTHRKMEKKGTPAEVGKALVDELKGLALLGVDIAEAYADVGIQILRGTADVLGNPGTGEKLMGSLETIAKAPEFQTGAAMVGIPVAVSTYAYYAHPGGKAQREKLYRLQKQKISKGKASKDSLAVLEEERKYSKWREKNPKLYAGLVAGGAAITGGIATKVLSDIYNVI